MNRRHMTTPCENCPYRMDAPRKYWHRSEFEKVLRSERQHMGTTFACHKQYDLPAGERGFCAGWLLDQKKRGLPSIALRIALMNDRDAQAALDRVTNAGFKMFRTVKAMCRANGVRR